MIAGLPWQIAMAIHGDMSQPDLSLPKSRLIGSAEAKKRSRRKGRTTSPSTGEQQGGRGDRERPGATRTWQRLWPSQCAPPIAVHQNRNVPVTDVLLPVTSNYYHYHPMIFGWKNHDPKTTQPTRSFGKSTKQSTDNAAVQ